MGQRGNGLICDAADWWLPVRMDMDVFIDHELRFRPPSALLEPLRKLVTWPNPERAIVAQSGRPYHHVPAEWCALDIVAGDAQARLPRGLLPQLRDAAKAANVGVRWVPRVTFDPGAQEVPLSGLVGTLRDYQIEAVQSAKQQRQGVVVLPCGCLTGDAEIVVNRAGKAFRSSLADLVRGFNGQNRGQKWDPSIPIRIQAVDADGMRRLDEVVRAFPTGTKEVFRVVLHNGQTIKATADHRFLTPDGWRRLHELAPDRVVMVVETGRKSKTGLDQREHGERKKYVRKGGMLHHPYSTSWTSSRSRDRGMKFALVPEHRLVVEAALNGMALAEFIARIKAGNIDGLKFLDPGVYDVHHIDRNTENNELSNLEVLKKSEHQRVHATAETGKHCHPFARPERIKSIESAGMEQTYDLTMKAPEANYVANGFVVHNSGKTVTGCAFVIHLNQRAVVVVPSVDICEQWVRTLRRLRPGVKVRAVHGGEDWSDTPLTPGEIAVGVDDSLVKAGKLLASAGVLVTDETHRVASKTWRAIVAQCPARWRIGFTATPERADGWGLLLPCLLGPVLLERSQRWLVEQGYLAQPTIYAVATGTEALATDYRTTTTCPRCKKEIEVDETRVRLGFVRCEKVVMVRKRRDVCGGAIPVDAVIERTFSVGRAGSRVASSQERLSLVRQVCRWSVDRDRDVLVLVPRVSVVGGLVKQLVADGIPAVGLTGAENRKVRAAALEALGQRRYRVLVATQLADEGLDLPRMDTLVNTSAGKAAGNAAQRVGRVCRPEGNPPLVFDFVDGGSAYMRQWQARSRAYRRAYGEISVPEKKPIPLREVLVRCEVKGEPGRMF